MNAGPLKDSSWEMPTLEIQRQTRFIFGVYICLVGSRWPRGLVSVRPVNIYLIYLVKQLLKFISCSFKYNMQNKVRHGRWERTEPAFRKKLSLSQMAFRRRKKCWNVRKGTDNSSNSLQQRLTRPGLFPWWEGNEQGNAGGKHRPGPGCRAPISLCLSHTVSLSLSFNLSLSMRNLLSRSKKNFFKGEKPHNPNVEGLKQQGVLLQVSDLWVDRTQTRWGFDSAKWEKSFSSCQIANKICPGLGHFLLWFQFVVKHWLCLWTALSVTE